MRQADSGRLAVVHGDRLLLVGADRVDEAGIRRLWDAVGAAAGLGDVIDVLARDGVSRTPEFVLAEWRPDGEGTVEVRCAVRGATVLRVDTPAGADDIDAATATTWLERTVAGATGFSLEAAEDGDADDTAPWLPLADGAVRVSAVRMRATDADAADESTRVLPRRVPGPRTPAEPAAEVPEKKAPAPKAPEAEPPAAKAPEAGQAAAKGPDSEPPAGAPPVADDTAAPPAADPPAAPPAGDHDGRTMLAGDIARMRTRAAGAASAPVTSPTPEQVAETTMIQPGSAVPAPPSAKAVPAPPAAKAAPAPPASDPGRTAGGAERTGYLLQLPDGAEEPLNAPLLVGRSPSIRGQVSAPTMPRLVTIADGDQDISRTHLRFTVEGDTVVVTDMHSRNGTIVVLPGKAPQKLRAGEPTSVIADTVVDLGGGVRLTVRRSHA